MLLHDLNAISQLNKITLVQYYFIYSPYLNFPHFLKNVPTDFAWGRGKENPESNQCPHNVFRRCVSLQFFHNESSHSVLCLFCMTVTFIRIPPYKRDSGLVRLFPYDYILIDHFCLEYNVSDILLLLHMREQIMSSCPTISHAVW